MDDGNNMQGNDAGNAGGNEGAQGGKPYPLGKMTIILMSDGNPIVTGFPSTLSECLALLGTATIGLSEHFMKLAVAQELDENMRIIPKKIISPTNKGGLVNPAGRPI